MPRKKITRRVSKSSRKIKKPAAVTIQKLENDFAKAPQKMTAQLNKEIRALRQVESKLKKALNKCAIQVSKSESRVQKVEAKATPAAKKQLSSARKTHSKNLQAHNQANAQLEKTTRLLSVVDTKHAKLVALTKHLADFERDWNKSQKAASAAAPRKSAKRRLEEVKPATPATTSSDFSRAHEDVAEELAETVS